MISIPASIIYFILGFITCFAFIVVFSIRLIKKTAEEEVKKKATETIEWLKYLRDLKDENDDKDEE